MAKNEELQAQIEQLRRLLTQHGITEAVQPATDPTERGDYIEFGSPEHLALLGLVEVEDVEKAKADKHIIHVSPKTGMAYRLEDQVTPFMHYPDPRQVAELVLQQKVSSFESGPPQVPENAPPMWQPRNYVPA